MKTGYGIRDTVTGCWISKLKGKSKKKSNCTFGTASLVLTGCLGFGFCDLGFVCVL